MTQHKIPDETIVAADALRIRGLGPRAAHRELTKRHHAISLGSVIKMFAAKAPPRPVTQQLPELPPIPAYVAPSLSMRSSSPSQSEQSFPDEPDAVLTKSVAKLQEKMEFETDSVRFAALSAELRQTVKARAALRALPRTTSGEDNSRAWAIAQAKRWADQADERDAKRVSAEPTSEGVAGDAEAARRAREVG